MSGKIAIPRSGIQGIHWPALPNPVDAEVLALQHQFRQSQWLPARQLLGLQLGQLELLLQHAAATVPFYKDRLVPFAAREKGTLSLKDFMSIPVLTRSEVQQAGEALISGNIPKRHGKVGEVRTSGSTGRPIAVKCTDVTSLFFSAMNLRYHRWHRRAPGGKVACIRTLKGAQAKAAEQGKPVSWHPAHHSGPMFLFDATATVGDQMAWLEKTDPDYLLIYPSLLRNILDRAEQTGFRLPKLCEVSTFSEVLPENLCEDCLRLWGVPLHDSYSSQELGVLAMQCPDHAHYHVMSESVLLEVLDEAGRPCPPGRMGRVVVTDLHNFAMPLLRYEIGDFAEPGPPCSCGRGLPVLNRIVGRYRNLIVLPGGERFYPRYPKGLTDHAPVLQFQLVQHDLKQVEVRLVVARALGADEEAAVIAAFRESLHNALEVSITYMDEIPRSAGGKYEDVLCLVA